jgi:hypothetical protein
MLLQRLIVDHNGKFNYDYMGASEYEFGATRAARIKLAALALAKDLRGKPVSFAEAGSSYVIPSCYAFGSSSHINQLPDDLRIPVTKEPFNLNDMKIQGWLKVDPYDKQFEPLLIIRAEEANIQRGTAFIDVFLEQMKDAQKERNWSDAYLNGWADASALCRSNNPYPKGSKEADDYDYGYRMSMEENF